MLKRRNCCLLTSFSEMQFKLSFFTLCFVSATVATAPPVKRQLQVNNGDNYGNMFPIPLPGQTTTATATVTETKRVTSIITQPVTSILVVTATATVTCTHLPPQPPVSNKNLPLRRSFFYLVHLAHLCASLKRFPNPPCLPPKQFRPFLHH